MRLLIGLFLLSWIFCVPPTVLSETSGVRPLYCGLADAVASLSPHTHVLLDRDAIERFLVELDGLPPDWMTAYGQGHHDPGHDDRLFALNRERDAGREGKGALQWLIAFVWLGEISRFDEELGGFVVGALGPKFTATGWGDVRFKYEDLPPSLVALPGKDPTHLKQRLSREEPVDVDVLMVGRLIPEESLVYDFSHEKEGRGLIMPVVRIEAVEFALKGDPERRDDRRMMLSECRMYCVRGGEDSSKRN